MNRGPRYDLWTRLDGIIVVWLARLVEFSHVGSCHSSLGETATRNREIRGMRRAYMPAYRRCTNRLETLRQPRETFGNGEPW
jgi:hypothetical protein